MVTLIRIWNIMCVWSKFPAFVTNSAGTESAFCDFLDCCVRSVYPFHGKRKKENVHNLFVLHDCEWRVAVRKALARGKWTLFETRNAKHLQMPFACSSISSCFINLELAIFRIRRNTQYYFRIEFFIFDLIKQIRSSTTQYFYRFYRD